MDAIALSPTHRLIAVWHRYTKTICLFDVYTGHPYDRVLCQRNANMAFIRAGTKLANYFPNFGLRIWDIADLTDEYWHSTCGYELISRGMRDGWVTGRNDKSLFWVPAEQRNNLCVLPSPRVVIVITQEKATKVDLSKSRLSRRWMEHIDKEWLRELERREVGSKKSKWVLFSAKVLVCE